MHVNCWIQLKNNLQNLHVFQRHFTYWIQPDFTHWIRLKMVCKIFTYRYFNPISPIVLNLISPVCFNIILPVGTNSLQNLLISCLKHMYIPCFIFTLKRHKQNRHTCIILKCIYFLINAFKGFVRRTILNLFTM